MKSIIVKIENGAAIYTSGIKHTSEGNGEWKLVEETDEEQMQHCYDALVGDVKRQEFNKTMKLLILSYLRWPEGECENIQIVVTPFGKSSRRCEMNIRVNTDWSKVTKVEMPDSLTNDQTTH